MRLPRNSVMRLTHAWGNSMQQRYLPILGFNSKQWWAYDERTGEVIDPPMGVLKEIKSHPMDEQEGFFEELLSKEPDWLNDKDYRFLDIEI